MHGHLNAKSVTDILYYHWQNDIAMLLLYVILSSFVVTEFRKIPLSTSLSS